MKVAPLIAVALILCIAFPGPIQAKKKPKPKFCVGKDGNQYAVGEGYDDNDGKACVHYKCVKKKKKFVMKKGKCIEDGEWSPWSSWSACSSTCGSATKTRKRTCSSPAPSNGGNPCSGPEEQIEQCSNPSCGPDVNMKVDSLELNFQSLNGSMQALQTTMLSVLELMTTMQSTADKQGTCMSDLSSSDCPDSAPGKVGVVDGISTNKAGVTSVKADINTNQAGINTNKAGINTNKAGINTNKAGINTNKGGINTNKAGISTNKAGVTSAKADINTNKAGISTNKAGVTSAKADINTTKAGISTNKAGVTSAMADINTNKAGINTNKVGINTNKAGINTNKADINTNKANINTNKAGINTNKADINTNKADVNTNKAAINTNMAGIMENKASIAAHHGGLIHTDATYEYYKVPVPASSKMTSAVVLTTCIKLGMKPQCFSLTYADSNCVQAPSTSIHNEHPSGMSQILCSTIRPQDCASTLNMFWYMNPDNGWHSGSACGATKAGSFCSYGKDYTSTIDMQYFAACLKPVTTDWTIIQRRGQYGNAEDYFYKDFKDYEDGFGSGGELWIGLKKLAALTKDGEWEWELQVDLTDWDDKKYHAKYATFSVGPAPTYTLHVGGFDDSNSTLGDSMTYHSGSAFSAPDKDQDSSNFFDCAVHYKGGWWYESCLKANINGLNFAQQKDVNGGMTWYFGGGRGNYWKTWKASVMKITRVKV